MTYPTPYPIIGSQPQSAGELALEDRSALRRVAGLSTELADVSEVEYRQLRLERVVLVGVWTEGSAADAEASLAELAALAETAGSEVLEGAHPAPRQARPVDLHRLGQGRRAARSRRWRPAPTPSSATASSSPAQLTALEKAVKVKVIDRTALILDIFAQHATSREGKAQVALAQMEYMLPRLRGWGESMSRQAGGRAGGSGGGVGLRGPGETKIETDRRRIRERMAKLRREIKDMKTGPRHPAQPPAAQRRPVDRDRRLHQRRQVEPAQRAHRRRRAGRERAVRHPRPDHPPGRIRRRPRRSCSPTPSGSSGTCRTQLVEAFRSTLEEVVDADLLVHVVDGSDVNPLAQINAVREVITDVIADHRRAPAPELLVVNKIDAAERSDAGQAAPRAARRGVRLRAHRRRRLDALRRRMAELAAPTDTAVDVVIPYDRGDLVARVHADGRVHATEHNADGTRIKARVPVALAASLREFAAH